MILKFFINCNMPLKDSSDFKKYPGIKGGLCNAFKLYSRHRKPMTSNIVENKKSDARRVLDPGKDLHLGKGLNKSKDSLDSEVSKSCFDQSLNYSNSSIDSGTEMEARSDDLYHVLESKLEVQRKNKCKLEPKIISRLKEPSKNVKKLTCAGSNEGSNLTVIDETTSFMKICSKQRSKPNIEDAKFHKSQITNPIHGIKQTSQKVDQNCNLELCSKVSGKIETDSEFLIFHTCRICGKKYKTEVGLKVRMNSIH